MRLSSRTSRPPEPRPGSRFRAAALGLFFLAACVAAGAGSPGAPLPPAPPAAPADSIFHITADHLDGRKSDQGEIVVLTGNVIITQGDFRARGDRGEYRKEEGVVTLDGNTRVSEKGMTMDSRSARYFRFLRRLDAEGDVRLADSTALVRAPAGQYFRDEGRAELTGGCFYKEGSREIQSRRMTYLRDTAILDAVDSVVVVDREDGVHVEGTHAHWWDREDRGWVTGRPRLVSIPDTSGTAPEHPYDVLSDTLFVDRTAKQVTARGDVAFHQGDTQGSAVEARFFQSDEHTELSGKPVIHQGRSEIHGDRVFMKRKKGELESILVQGGSDATYVAPDSVGGNEVPPSTITGDEMTLAVQGGRLDSMIVVGKAHARYYPPPGEGGKKGEWNDTRGDTMVLGFDAERLTRVNVRGTASGIHHLAPQDTANASAGMKAKGDSASAQPDSSTYSGDSIAYNVATKIIDLHGKAETDYGSVRLKAGDIHLDSDSQELRARSYPVVFDGEQKMLGRVMTYNMRTRKGDIYGGRAAYEKGYYSGNIIHKVSDQVLDVDDGIFTSCDDKTPHYSFRSRRMKVYVGDRVIAKPLVLYLGPLPVLPLPFFIFPIQGTRRSGLLIPDTDFGGSSSTGHFVRHLGYYWVPNDYADFKAWGDWFQNQSWVGYMEARYKKIYLLEGNVDASYQRDYSIGHTRWDLTANHRQDLDENTVLTARADFVSDVTYRQDIVAGLAQQLDRQLESDVSLARRWEGANLNVALSRSQNLDTGSINRTLPSLSASLYRRPLLGGSSSVQKNAPWYRTFFYDASGDFRNDHSKDPTSTSDDHALSGTVNLSSQSAFGSPRLSYRTRVEQSTVSTSPAGTPTRAMDNAISVGGSPRLWGWLELSPSANLEDTWFNRGALVGGLPTPGGWRRTWDLRGSSRTNLYGTFFPHWGPLVGVRHVMTPQVGFTYQPSFPEYTNRFQGVGGVGASSFPGHRSVDLGLTNNLHLKVRHGEKTQNLNNVASLQFNTSYDFRWREQGALTGWSPLRSSLAVQPAPGTDLRLDTSHNLPDWILTSLSVSATYHITGAPPHDTKSDASPWPKTDAPAADWYLDPLTGVNAASPLAQPWTLSLSQHYTRLRGVPDSYWLEGSAERNLFAKWRAAYSARVDFVQHDVITQQWYLYRDLHCWEARFTRAYVNKQWLYYFKINIKALPEIYAQRGERSLSR